VQRVAAGRLSDVQEQLRLQIALTGGGRTYLQALVRGPHLGQALVGVRVHGNGGQALRPARPDDAQCDLTAIGHHDSIEHRRGFRGGLGGGQIEEWLIELDRLGILDQHANDPT